MDVERGKQFERECVHEECRGRTVGWVHTKVTKEEFRLVLCYANPCPRLIQRALQRHVLNRALFRLDLGLLAIFPGFPPLSDRIDHAHKHQEEVS
jgi:hypothetical protein